MSAITISTLDDPVAIVHIPIELADKYASNLYWSLTEAPQLSPEFFNVTSNQIELAVFARTDLVNRCWANVADDRLQISSTWRVFEISSGDGGDSNNYDSPHLRHVSAPLSKAGISILYQSSYFSDYILVRETHFARTSGIFAQQGWNFEASSPPSRRRSQLLSPITPCSRSSPVPQVPLVPVITVLPSPLACIGFDQASERATEERVRQLVVWPERARESWKQKRQSGSHWPDRSSDALVDYSAAASTHLTHDRPFISYTRTVNGASIVTETRILRVMFGRKQTEDNEHAYGDEGYGYGYGSEAEGTEYQLEGQLAAGYVTDTTDLEDRDDEDGKEDEDGAGPAGTPATSVRDSSRSRAFDQDIASGLHTPPADAETKRDRHLSLPLSPRESLSFQGSMPISWRNNAPARRSTISLRSGRASDKRRSWDKASHSQPSRVGTDTDADDGHSTPGAGSDKPGRKRCLQLDMRGIQDQDDTPISSRTTPLTGEFMSPITPYSEGRGEALGGAACDGPTSDLPPDVYHMDKSGLVTNFSDLLNSGSIRMLYSSTFHTANVLVEARDVHLARRLLQGRGRTPAVEKDGYF